MSFLKVKGGNPLKHLLKLFSFILFMVFLVACSDDSRYLIRADVQIVNEDESLEEEEMILDIITLDSIKSIIHEVDWEQESDEEMVRKEDVLVTLFYKEDEDSPEQLFLYRIWYHEDQSVSIISNNEEEGYGTLDEEFGIKLKNILTNGQID